MNAEVLHSLEALVPLAPLHQPHNLALIRTLMSTAPGLPQVACFDTAFHATQPAIERAFALPRQITERGVRRYGFHGLSYEHVASAMLQHDPGLSGRVVVLHLGNGASMCAMQGGKSMANTMGFTALDGLPMGTRCGALAAILGGLDGIVFTAGIGENSARVRERVCRDAAWLGLELDEAANHAGSTRISKPNRAVSAWIIPTDEEAVIASHTRRLRRIDPVVTQGMP